MVKLLVAALEEELSAFPTEIPGWAIVVTGVGKVLAATELTAAVLEHRPESILVVGTAGSIGPLPPGAVIFPTATIQTDATRIDELVGRAVSAPHLIAIPGGRDEVIIGTADAFIDDAERVAQIRAVDPATALVDMETYAYVHVAARYGIPITVAKAVSDSADEHAATTWPTTVARCSAALWLAVQDGF